MKLTLRREEEKDYKEVEVVTREAFWDVYRPGCFEHLVVHKIRKVPAFIKELSFVAEADERIAGNIMFSKAKVVDENEAETEVLSMGLVGVLPDFQGQGIGSKLIKETLDIARGLGYGAVIIFGNPKYYQRFGFRNAQNYAITTSNGKNFDAFMALELRPNALQGVSGRFFEDSVFDVQNSELEEFEKNFPHKEKHVTETQLKPQ